MSNNKMLIDASHPEETRVAIVRGNRVDEFDFESEHKTQLRGNIYLAKVTRVEPSLQAAFVDYGGNRHGFLAFSEIHPDYYQIPQADRQALLDAEAADARAEEEAQASAEENDSEEQPVRKRRSRSRGGRNSASDKEAGDGEEASDETADTQSDEEENATAETEPAPEPKKPRRSRRKKAAPKNDDGNTAANSEENDDSEEEIGAENDGDDVVSESADEKPKRRRTSRPKKVKTETAVDPVESEPQADAPKTRRKTSRKKAEPAAEDTPAAETIAEEAPAPKRRTTRRRKVAEVEETVEETAVVAETPVAEVAQDKPKKRRSSRRRKPESSDETPADENVAAEASEEVSAEDSPEETEKPSRRRRSRGRGRRNNNENAETPNGDEDDEESIENAGAEDALEELPPRRVSRRHYKIQEVIKRRQILLVQVVKEERGNKGAALTTYLSLAGRYSVLMPNTARGGGISRKITNAADRKRLKTIATGLDVPAGMGVILRTAGASRTEQEVQRDFEYLLRLWENVRTLTLESTAPFLVYEEGSLIKRSIRDLYDKDTGEIIVAGEEGFREAKEFMAMLMPDHAKNVKLYKDRVPMFAKLGVESQLDAMLQPQVTLKSGGYLVLNQTEALVAIDVNSGRSTRQHSIEETAVATNLEAADEVARQLRLRDLAGLIVIDFIDMEERRNNRAVEKRIKEALKNDRARIQVGRISHFGLMEMSRQRIRASVLESTTQVCPVCEGVGHVRSSSSVVLGILRTIEEQLNKNSRNNLTVKVNGSSAVYLLNNKREHLSDLETRFGISLQIEIDDKIGLEPCIIERGELARKRQVAETAVQPDTIAPDAIEQENSEVTADAPAINTDAPDAPQQNEEGQGDGRKRRRRRRRRKGSDHTEQSATENTSSAVEIQASDTPESQPVSEDAASPQEPSEAEAHNDGRKSRRRTSRVKNTDETDNVPQAEVSDVVTDEKPASEETPTERPKRSRRSRSKKSDAVEAKSPETVVETGDATAEDVKPKRRTTRRKSEDASAETDESPAAEPAQAPQEVESSSESKKDGWWRRKFF